MVSVDRRTALVVGAALGGAPSLLAWRRGGSPPALVRDRLEIPTGVRSGDVTEQSATVWAAASGEGRLDLRLESNGRRLRSVRGPWADERTDHTARLTLRGLAPGREYDATVWFTGPDGTRGREHRLTFSTAPIHPAAQSFVWSGDACGQGWGINPDLGGMTGYRAMLDVRPDFLLHCGDAIYADEPIPSSQVEYDGSVWRNLVTEEVSKAAETLREFRGRYRYLLLDEHVRAFNAAVPTVAQWDDHETTNNWYPGRVLDDEQHADRYANERRCDVLAARARRAWQEHTPIAVTDLNGRGTTGFAEQRIYRKVSRGAHLDVFCLDMRSHRGSNELPVGSAEPGILGRTQADWLIREVSRSRATWKVIAADQPLSIFSRHLDDRDGPSNGDHGAPLGREDEIARVLSAFRRAGVRNVVFLTADVHYAAAQHYHPARASFTDFHPFWEFVAGPIHSSTFSVKEEIDRTFGPEIVFARGNDDGRSQGPRWGNQYFGHCEIAASGELTVSLRTVGGEVLWRRVLEPEERPALHGPALAGSGGIETA